MTSGFIDRIKYSRGYALLPETIDLLLTNDCNLNCGYCPQKHASDKGAQAFKRTFMNVGKVFSLLNQFAEFKPHIRFFGGEPFVHPEWDVITRYASDLGLSCSCVTNGTLIRDQAERIIQSGLASLGVSMDGYEASSWKGRGVNLSERIFQGLAELDRLKQKSNAEHPHIHIYTTAHRDNVHHLVDFARFLVDKNISLYRIQQLIWFSSDEMERSIEILNNCFSNVHLFGPEAGFVRDSPPGIDGGTLQKQYDELKKMNLPFSLLFQPGIVSNEFKTYHTPEYHRDFAGPCRVFDKCAYIDPAGRIHPCISLEMGNAFKKPFTTVWNNSRFRKFRRLIRRKGRLPLCIRCPA